MALVTSGEDDIISLKLWLPRVGVWTADVLFDTPNPRTGRVKLQVGDRQFTGTIDRGGEFEDTDRTRVVGGAAGMNKLAARRQYQSPSVGLVARALLATAGETLSPTADQGVLARSLGSWTTSEEPIGVVLTALLQSTGAGAVWRVLADGTIWIGRESWPDAGLDAANYEVMDKRFEDGSWMATVNEASASALLPGTTFEGQHVSLVVHHVDDEEVTGPRMRVWFSDADEGTLEDRVGAAFERAVRAAGPGPVDYRAHYRARVVAQVGNNVHVEPELGTMPDMGSVPMLFGLPGVSMTGLIGGSVLVGWRGGDRAKSYAVCFDPDNQVQTMILQVLVQLILGDRAAAEPFLKALSYGTAWGTLAGAFSVYVAAIAPIADPIFSVTPLTSPTGILQAALAAFTAALAGCATLKVSGT